MTKRINNYTTEQLADYRLVDVTPRPIRLSDEVEASCPTCGNVERIRFELVKNAKSYTGNPRMCRPCRAKSGARGGEAWLKKRATSLANYGETHYSKTKERDARVKKTHLERIGVEHPSQTQEWQDKKRAATQERHGVEHWLQDPANHQKIQATMLDRHGALHFSQTKEWRRLVNDHYRMMFGVDWFQQTPEFHEKARQTNLRLYGHEHYRQSEEGRRRIIETCRFRYGVDNYCETERFKLQVAWTNTDRYGSRYVFLSKHFAKLRALGDWRTSKGEQEVLWFMRGLGFNAHKHYLDGHELDIFVPELNLAIEYHGEYWHSEIFKKPNAHVPKMIACGNHGIQLIQIFEHEWKSRNLQVVSRLKAVTRKSTEKIGASKCKIRPVDLAAAALFCNQNHVQGRAGNNARWAIGLYRDDRLVSVGVFGNHHRQGKGGTCLIRFCSLAGMNVQGGLGRISKAGYEKNGRRPILSWADLRWSTGNAYKKVGWAIDGYVVPSYFYWGGGVKVMSKQSRRKSAVKTPAGMTEHEHALDDGLLRVYDAGKIRFVYDPDRKALDAQNS